MPAPAKILVVDDQDWVRRTLCLVLAEREDWRVYEAGSGKMALQQARAIKPDVVVLDIVMPDMNGLETAYELRSVAPEAKIVFVSSHYTAEDASIVARLYGNGSFVQKSDTGTQLIEAINAFL